MKYILILSFVFFVNLLKAQFSCENIELLGIYFNNLNTSQISLLLTNKSEVNDGNQDVYTGFQIITNQGDTILTSQPCQCFKLPNSLEDTIVYNLEIFEQFGTIYDLPNGFCGKIITQFPDCEIDFCKNEIIHPNLPQLQEANCNDYKIVGFYETANGGNSNYSFLLTFTNPNFRGIGPTGYTTFEFINENQESLSDNTGPHFTMPQYIQDTIIVHMDFHEQITPNFCSILKTTLPECEINYCDGLTSTNGFEKISNIEIFPNPTTGQISISEDLIVERVKLFNYLGLVVLKENRNHFNINQLTNGIYIVEIKLKNKEKFITKIFKY